MTTSTNNVPSELVEFCQICGENLGKIGDDNSRVQYTRAMLPRLLLNRKLFADIIESALAGGSYPDIRRPTMFDNEVLLYMDPQGVFSLRMYLWGPGDYTVPHDHSSWGVIGSPTDGYEVIDYHREDDGSEEGHARISPAHRHVLKAGETAYTLPFDAGIHKTGNPTEGTIISLNFYGKPVPRGFVYGFDVENRRVYKILPPKRKKEHLMRDALQLLK